MLLLMSACCFGVYIFIMYYSLLMNGSDCKMNFALGLKKVSWILKNACRRVTGTCLPCRRCGNRSWTPNGHREGWITRWKSWTWLRNKLNINFYDSSCLIYRCGCRPSLDTGGYFTACPKHIPMKGWVACCHSPLRNSYVKPYKRQ